MAVYVRDLTRAEGNRLMEIARRGKSPIAVRRAQVLIASDQGMKAPEIAKVYHLSPDYVRKIIHRYNTEGFESVHAKYENGGRPPKFTPEECSLILEIANIPPKILGLPFTHWSLMKLRDHLVKCRVIPGISHEQLRQILKRANWSLQRVKTWKESNDPEFESKKNGSSGSTRKRRKGDG
jgi:transposase